MSLCRTARARESGSAREPYVYPYLTAVRVRGSVRRPSVLSRAQRGDRTRVVLEQLGSCMPRIASGAPVESMLQRTGLAAALVADPELLIPTSR